MPARRRRSELEKSRRRPATTPEMRENELVSKAHDLAERMIEDGSASSQVITHFLKLGSTRERLEQQRLEHENELTRVKIEAIASQARIEELYRDAIKAMRTYAGDTMDDDLDGED
jgi:hypothetical protein